VILDVVFGTCAGLSIVLLCWQWLAGRRFALHRRHTDLSFVPAVSLLKPLKGSDAATEQCLRSWLAQDYAGPVQILFGVASADDPAVEVVERVLRDRPSANARLVVCGELAGTNAKASKLARLEDLSEHDVLVISDADVWVPPDFLANVVAPLKDPQVGLVNCFYSLATPSTLAMRWEAIAVNADFWSQVLQSQMLKPLDFALGAVMATRRQQIDEIGGFRALVDCLADDYQLGNRIARKGYRIELSPVVVECRESPMNWRAVWAHQLRWARTIRVCQPVPYFFSVLSNATLWPLLWWLLCPSTLSLGVLAGAAILRLAATADLQWRLTRSVEQIAYAWLAPLKDLLQAALWACAFAGNRIEWRGQPFVLRRDGTLARE